MNVTAQAEMTPESSNVAELLSRRAQVEQWLARLDQADPEVPERVIARVREDYEGRLRAITEELAAHRTTLEAEVERLTLDSAAAAANHEAAIDALEEDRLRQRIGELTDEQWEERRPTLEAAVATSAEHRAAVESETESLRSVLDQLRAGDPPPARSRVSDYEGVEPLVAEHLDSSEDLAFELDPFGMELPEGILDLPPLEPLDMQGVTDYAIPGLEFLEEVDRAIAEPGEQPAAPALDALETGSGLNADPAPSKGVKCAECGYTNDAAAWYCGVCGVDLS